MSCYQSEKQMLEWCEATLGLHLSAEEYPLLFAALRAPRKTQRLHRVELGVLRILLTEKPPAGRDEKTAKRYSSSNKLTREELAEIIHCHPSTVSRGVRRINRLVREGGRIGSAARRHGLILFSDLGYCIYPFLWDAERSRSFSGKQLGPQVEAHESNIQLADERGTETQIHQQQLSKFNALSPKEQRRALEAAGIA